MRKWRCTVCGYIHYGDKPPEKCPVCGADKEKFEEIDDQKFQTLEADSPDTAKSLMFKRLETIYSLMIKHHIHPISVHVPNGIIPAAVIFIILALAFNCISLSQATLFNLVFVAFALPLVLFSGYNEWKRKYGGNLSGLFLIKILCAVLIAVTVPVLIIWLYVDPGVATWSSPHKWIFLIVNFIMLGAATVAGFIGGKLVFKE